MGNEKKYDCVWKFGTKSFIDYEQAFDSVDRRALGKVLSLYGIPEKYIKVICAIYENNIAAVKGRK